MIKRLLILAIVVRFDANIDCWEAVASVDAILEKSCALYQGGNPGPKVIKLFSCSTQLSLKFFLVINVKMPTTVGILTLVSGKNSILGLSEPKKSLISYILTLISI